MRTFASLQQQYAEHREFYPGDMVIIVPEYYRKWLTEHDRTFFVHSTNEDGSRIGSLRHVSSNWMWLPDLGPDQAVVVDHGALYNYLFAPHMPVEFIDKSDETEFWLDLDMAEQVQNPVTGFWIGWTDEQARDALKSSLIDVVFPEWPLDQPTYGFVRGRLAGNAYRFADRTIGERIRAATIARLERLATLG